MIPKATQTNYKSRAPWDATRPRVLVVACSDGRLQENLDDFLSGHLGIVRYDRLYAPGGPGALATSGVEFMRSDQFRRECLFLVEAHQVEEVILIFHGPAPHGPDEATCADYRRIFPRLDADAIRDQQTRDMTEILGSGFGWQRSVRVRVFRCEVARDGSIQFVTLHG